MRKRNNLETENSTKEKSKKGDSEWEKLYKDNSDKDRSENGQFLKVEI